VFVQLTVELVPLCSVLSLPSSTLAFVGSVAEAAGFEPARRLPAYTLSRRAPSSARAGLRRRV